MPDVTRIYGLQGITHFAFFKSPSGKRIALLGENHNDYTPQTIPGWPTALDWIRTLNSRGICMDLFLEDIHYDLPDASHPEYMSLALQLANGRSEMVKTRYEFDSCHDYRAKPDCAGNNMRVQYTDQRNLYSGTQQQGDAQVLTGISDSLIPLIDYKINDPPSYKINVRELVKSFLTGDIDGMMRPLLEFDAAMGRANIGYKPVFNKAKLSIYMTGLSARIQKALHKIKNPDWIIGINNGITEVYTALTSTDKRGATRLIELMPIYMDYFALLRLHQSFDPAKINRGPLNCRKTVYNSAKNVVFLAGGVHTAVYELVLRKMGSFGPLVYSEGNYLLDNTSIVGNINVGGRILPKLKAVPVTKNPNGFNYFE
jgi:hypothetical protein